jgi:peptidylamidoglycolate lyase
MLVVRRSKSIVFAVMIGVLTTSAARPADSYHVVHGWPQLPPGEALGQATGVDVDSRGNVLVFHRAGRRWSEPMPTTTIGRGTIWVFEKQSGRLVRSWGANLFVMPHGLTVDAHDNVWVTDVGLHQVFKFSAQGELLLKLGTEREAGSDSRRFNRPTDVAVLKDGSFYVSDGYRNTRIIKFAAGGRFEFQWGTKGAGPGEFDLPHGLALDPSDRVYVADRSNARVQVFDAKGRFLAQWRGSELGRPYAIAFQKNGNAFVADGGDQPDAPPDRSGVAIVDPDGKVLERFGRYGNYDGQFQLAHDIAVDQRGAVYVVDAWGERLQKFVRE